MSVNEALIEKGAKALRDDTAYASSYARKVLEAVLPDMVTQLEALPHTDWVDPNGRPRPCPQEWPGGPCTCIRGQAIAILQGERRWEQDENSRTVADLETRLAAARQQLSDIEAQIVRRCDAADHRSRVPTPSSWEVCAKCRPYLAIVRGES